MRTTHPINVTLDISGNIERHCLGRYSVLNARHHREPRSIDTRLTIRLDPRPDVAGMIPLLSAALGECLTRVCDCPAGIKCGHLQRYVTRVSHIKAREWVVQIHAFPNV